MLRSPSEQQQPQRGGEEATPVQSEETTLDQVLRNVASALDEDAPADEDSSLVSSASSSLPTHQMLMEREWRRYTSRRSRYVRSRPDLLLLRSKVTEKRRHVYSSHSDLSRAYARRQRDLLRLDPELVALRRAYEASRRSYVRLQKRLDEELMAGIGPAPF